MKKYFSHQRSIAIEAVFFALFFCILLLIKTPSEFLLAGGSYKKIVATIGLFLSFAAAVFYIARMGGLQKYAALLVAASVLYYALWLHFWPNLRYTNDVYGHIDYIKHLAAHINPYTYRGGEFWHPPTYYLFASVFYRFATVLGSIFDPLAVVRFFSLLLYAVFNIFALRTIQLYINPTSKIYQVSGFLSVFWPASMIMATRINNDVALYAVWAVFFFYICSWHTTRDNGFLRKALYALGVAFAVKSNAVILGGMMAIVLLCALIGKTLSFRECTNRKSMMAIGFVFLCLLINASRPIYDFIFHTNPGTLHFGGKAGDAISFVHFLKFNLKQFFLQPLNLFNGESGFISYVMKTSLYGEFRWKQIEIARLMNVHFLALLLMMILGARRVWFLGVVGVALPLLVLAIFTVKMRWVVCQDFRFIFPVIIPLTIVFANSMENLQNRGWWLLYYLGMAAAMAMPVYGMMFYLGEFISL